MAIIRDLGVHGINLEKQDKRVVSAGNMKIGGIIGIFERKYAVPMKVSTRDMNDLIDKFGGYFSNTTYGVDVVKGFIDNAVDSNSELYVKSHVGTSDGSTFDGVCASALLPDGTPQNILKLECAYQGEKDYSASGNRVGYQILNGFRFNTYATATAIASATTITVASVSGIKVGDIVRIDLTGGGTATVYKKITNVNEGLSTISWSGVMHATRTLALNDVVRVIGFQLKTYRQLLTGLTKEVDTKLGQIWCTTEPEVTDYYIENVFNAVSKWLKVTVQSTSPATLDLKFPVNVSTTTYLTAGADGTAPTTSTHWAMDLTAFNVFPVRFLTNAETSVDSIQKAGETYCKSRRDNPIWLYQCPMDRTKAQLITIGQGCQRSDDVLMNITHEWATVSDPYSNSPMNPDRKIPSVGHIMGAWIRSINKYGCHYIITKGCPIAGITGLVNTNLGTITDADRTDLANAGVNIIQYVIGSGYIVRNMFAPSTTLKYQFCNGLVMRNLIKISSEASLQLSENEPNSFAKIQNDRDAVYSFMYRLWSRGDKGTSPEGEYFGQYMKEDGTASKIDEHVLVIADAVNNPLNLIKLGERHIDVTFTYPSPAGLIEIGVAIQ